MAPADDSHAGNAAVARRVEAAAPTTQPVRSAQMSSLRPTGRPRLSPREGVGDPSDEILAVASRLFRERGVTGTTMSQIAREAGLQQSSLYYYFRGKEDVLSAIVDKANVVPLALVRRVQAEGGPAAVRLFRFVRGDVAALCALPFDINEVHRYAARDRERFAGYWKERRRLQRTLADIVRAGVDGGELRDVESRVTALTIMSNDEAVQNWYRLDAAPLRDVEAIGTVLAEMTVGGLLLDSRLLPTVRQEADSRDG
jgi:TetR/AcrR family transcriptional regulator